MLRSSIDLGTNTCLLLISEWDPKKKQVVRIQKDFSTIVRLGKGVDGARRLDPAAMQRTIDCLKGYRDEVKAAGLSASDTMAVATSQARDAANGAEFFATVEKETGFRFRTLSGDEEARFTFEGGLLPGMKPENSAVVDIGGGSTEFMSTKGGKSLDIGSVRFTERFLKSDPVQDEEFWSCQDAIDSELAVMSAWRKTLAEDVQLVAVAGTATTLAAWQLDLEKFDAAAIDQVELSRGDVHRMVEDLKWRTVQERTELRGIEAGRADVLLAGAMILWRSMEVLGFRTCRVSTRGLRFGVLAL